MAHQTISLLLTGAPAGTWLDAVKQTTPFLWSGAAARVRMALGSSATALESATGLSACVVTVYETAAMQRALLTTEAVALDATAGDVDATTWADGTKQHFLITLTDSETAMELPEDKESVTGWLQVTAVLSGGRKVLGGGPVVLRRAVAGLTAEEAALYYTKAETDAAIAAAGGATNLSTTATSTTVTVASDTGTDATLTAATGSAAGVMTAAMKSKLDALPDAASEGGNGAADAGKAAKFDAAGGLAVEDLTAQNVAAQSVGARSFTLTGSAGEDTLAIEIASGLDDTLTIPGGGTLALQSWVSEQGFITEANISTSASATVVNILSSAGTTGTLNAATESVAGIVTAEMMRRMNEQWTMLAMPMTSSMWTASTVSGAGTVNVNDANFGLVMSIQTSANGVMVRKYAGLVTAYNYLPGTRAVIDFSRPFAVRLRAYFYMAGSGAKYTLFIGGLSAAPSAHTLGAKGFALCVESTGSQTGTYKICVHDGTAQTNSSTVTGRLDGTLDVLDLVWIPGGGFYLRRAGATLAEITSGLPTGSGSHGATGWAMLLENPNPSSFVSQVNVLGLGLATPQ